MRSGDSIVFRDEFCGSDSSGRVSNGYELPIRQLPHIGACLRPSAVSPTVQCVLTMGGPRKVCERIVGGVTVEMPPKIILRARPNESLKDKMVCPPQDDCVFSMKADDEVPIRQRLLEFSNRISVDYCSKSVRMPTRTSLFHAAQDSAGIRNPVAREPTDRFRFHALLYHTGELQ